MWEYVNSFSNIHITDYESVACKWLCDKKNEKFNVTSAGVLWGLWLTSNDLVFNNAVWQDMRMILRKIWRCMFTWKPMFLGSLEAGVSQWCNYHEETFRAPLAISSS